MLYSVHAPEGIQYPEQPTVPHYQIPVFANNGRHRTDYVDAGPTFAVDFIDMASSRFSPQADSLKDLHIKAWENREGS
jgi:hypothetical protein